VRVLIDTSFALRGPSGTATYLHELVGALRAEGVEVLEARNAKRRPPAGGGAGSMRNLLADLAWTQATLPRRARGADVLHHPLPAIAARAPCPQVVTVHDLAFETHPDRFDRRFAAYARLAHRAAARRARAVIAVSETTAALVRERWGVAADRVVVAPHGPGQRLPAVEPRPPAHVLYVGDDEPRKNLGLLRAASLPLPLRIAGPAGERVDARELAELYAGALALVHPSVDEGFGLTPLEAMAAGCPVVAMPSPAVREVCGDAALYATTADDIASAVDALHRDPRRRDEAIERGRRRAREFSWQRSARSHVEAYRRALDGQ
jgi:glycosyltransferase involved in cell wall biosynthesis